MATAPVGCNSVTVTVLLCCGVNRLIVRLGSSQMRKTCQCVLDPSGSGFFPPGFFLFFFWVGRMITLHPKQVLLSRGRWRISQTLGPQSPRKFTIIQPSPMRPNELRTRPDNEATRANLTYHHLEPSPMRPNELWTIPDNGATRAKASGRQQVSCGFR